MVRSPCWSERSWEVCLSICARPLLEVEHSAPLSMDWNAMASVCFCKWWWDGGKRGVRRLDDRGGDVRMGIACDWRTRRAAEVAATECEPVSALPPSDSAGSCLALLCRWGAPSPCHSLNFRRISKMSDRHLHIGLFVAPAFSASDITELVFVECRPRQSTGASVLPYRAGKKHTMPGQLGGAHCHVGRVGSHDLACSGSPCHADRTPLFRLVTRSSRRR